MGTYEIRRPDSFLMVRRHSSGTRRIALYQSGGRGFNSPVSFKGVVWSLEKMLLLIMILNVFLVHNPRRAILASLSVFKSNLF